MRKPRGAQGARERVGPTSHGALLARVPVSMDIISVATSLVAAGVSQGHGRDGELDATPCWQTPAVPEERRNVDLC
eukprot:6463963-Lingulodinium_polyedra.AAC.1